MSGSYREYEYATMQTGMARISAMWFLDLLSWRLSSSSMAYFHLKTELNR